MGLRKIGDESKGHGGGDYSLGVHCHAAIIHFVGAGTSTAQHIMFSQQAANASGVDGEYQCSPFQTD